MSRKRYKKPRGPKLSHGQNFFKDPKTVRKLVKLARLSDQDLVIEIGPGEGAITRELAEVAGRVVAVEFDRGLASRLKNDFANDGNVEIVWFNFLKFKLPSEPYKLFANIPFNLTAPIMHKVLFAKQTPAETYFVMQQEAAQKYMAYETASTESSALFYPWFQFKKLAGINRHEFTPVPSVNAALLHMHPRAKPLVDPIHKPLFFKFIAFGFRSWKRSLKITYKSVFTYPQWKRLAKENRFPVDVLPSQLSPAQWLAIFRYFLVGVTDAKKEPIAQFVPDTSVKGR